MPSDFASCATLPPVVIASTFARHLRASAKALSVSSVLPENDDTITKDSGPT